MSKDEWLMEFQILNGRFPTDEETELAEIQGFQTAQVGIVKPAGKFQMKWDWYWFLRGILLVLVAMFGYIVGYLFT